MLNFFGDSAPLKVRRDCQQESTRTAPLPSDKVAHPLYILSILGTLFRNYKLALETTGRYAVLLGYTTRMVVRWQSHGNIGIFLFGRMTTRVMDEQVHATTRVRRSSV
jgi:hypothetical protein